MGRPLSACLLMIAAVFAPLSPMSNDDVAGSATLRGYATATNLAVERVDVSLDGGRSWSQAELEYHSGGPWSWTFWHATLELPKGEHELAVRAWDDAGQTQPALPDDTWNYKGLSVRCLAPCVGSGRVAGEA